MSDNPVFDRIQAEVADAPVMLYMKGTAMFPQCGFSARVVQILSHLNVPFKTANVLEDEALREGVKQFSSWPTVPQLYIGGEFVGGCDIVTEMYQSGELQDALGVDAEPTEALPEAATPQAPPVSIENRL